MSATAERFRSIGMYYAARRAKNAIAMAYCPFKNKEYEVEKHKINLFSLLTG